MESTHQPNAHSHPEHDACHAHEEAGACACATATQDARRQKTGIYLFSPSGAVPDPARLQQAKKNLKQLGFKVRIDKSAAVRSTRFAGTDKQRLKAFERAMRHEHPVVMATRGGYGLSRLLPQLDYKALADSGKQFVGHSDFTAFQMALLAQTGATSWAGPMALFDFGGKKVDDLTVDLFTEVLTGELEVLSFESSDADPVDERGLLWGGNLSVLVSLLGTPYFPNLDGILFLEDVNEHPYRVERMLIQLAQAGVLERQKAVLLGGFSDYRLSPHDAGYDFHEVLRWLRKNVAVPIVTGLPFGHQKVKATLPVGKQVGIATEDGMAYLLLHEHSH
ncbi:MAG: LD-carboxypeptidase [Pigmentiphaga sp.]|nr:LD-carboxypeptidase [Pigmentiphaga sp.]